MSLKFGNILVCACLRCVYHVTEAVYLCKVPAVVDSILVVSALTRWALLHSMCDLKAAQMHVKPRLIRKPMFYEFDLEHNTSEATKNICRANGEGAIDHSIVIRWLKKSSWGFKYIDDQARSGWLKAVDPRPCTKPSRENPTSSSWRVSGEFSIQSVSSF